ncbi:MAG: DUF6701 domain-containing protein [Halofilum sp. (in: g-proteobacteria)]|nr:DUF6701 domain-containing protein [Halofilum sp. (in: g-proteobacteria)]
MTRRSRWPSSAPTRIPVADHGKWTLTEPVYLRTAGSVSDYGNVTLDFGTNGSAPLDLVYPDAGEIRLHAREELQASGDDPAVTLNGTSNRFIVRPFGARM